MSPQVPPADVQHAFWLVLAAIGMLGGGLALLLGVVAWSRRKLVDLIVESINVKASVDAAMKEHEAREARWREEDRKEWREDLRDLRQRIEKVTDRWLDRALELLEEEKEAGK